MTIYKKEKKANSKLTGLLMPAQQPALCVKKS